MPTSPPGALEPAPRGARRPLERRGLLGLEPARLDRLVRVDAEAAETEAQQQPLEAVREPDRERRSLPILGGLLEVAVASPHREHPAVLRTHVDLDGAAPAPAAPSLLFVGTYASV